jgi:hypothetical protein
MIFRGILITLEDGIDKLFQNVGTELSSHLQGLPAGNDRLSRNVGVEVQIYVE